MNYRIIIKRTEPNPNYAKEIEEFEKMRVGYNRHLNDPYPGPELDVTRDILVTEITEAQFEAIRKAILDKF